jgi:hypothetical protein
MPGRFLLLSCLSLLAAATARAGDAPAPGARTYANPLDIDYRYNFEHLNEGISYRTGADPAIVRHGDAYYLFLTLADGYWRSTNLVDWKFVAPDRWPFESIVAPAVVSDGDRLVILQSSFEPRPLLQSTDPASGKLDFLTRLMPQIPTAMPPGRDQFPLPPGKTPPGPWDPDLFIDDDGQWYLYWDSSDHYPIYGIAMDKSPHGFAYRGKPTPLIALDPKRHGWERFGPDHQGANLSNGEPAGNYLEGAWMTKAGGRYYLQYAGPGTEYNVYANGAYVGDRPLGPFEYAPYNPIAYKPGGFVEGAGHGSTFADAHGNWWNTGTPWIGVNDTFERRIAMFPAKFFDDGQMEVSTRFGDFPHYVPDGKAGDPEALFTGWMLLSYRKRATASSALGEFAADHVTDENPRTFWVAADNAPGETLTVDLGGTRTLRAVQVDFADYKSERYGDAPDIYTEFELQSSPDGKRWQPLAATGGERRDRPNAYFQLPSPVRARYVRYVHGHVGAAHLAISDLRVFGNADGPPPRAPARVEAKRGADARDATVRWAPVPGAVGYNVRWGIRPDRLTLCYQVFAERGTALELRSLNVGVGYHVAVEAFDENGVSPLSEVVALP